ncbi:hypothetical protein KIN20_002380 [Parelaphostrongylus tenuis]|uniref:Ground-like domain-containing protein n=1 Tax=Parelaphostrongylus tenuis TaxID=148309 RepID=A0AAD5MGI9_PARTN|nr:hypothetical protein KIN20_002380 [Parelaphostrongylus tenuis]
MQLGFFHRLVPYHQVCLQTGKVTHPHVCHFQRFVPSGSPYATAGSIAPPSNPTIGGPPLAEENAEYRRPKPSYQGESTPAETTSGSNYAAPLNKFRLPQENCEPSKMRYVVLRLKKVPGSGMEEVMEEAEEIDHPPSVEATASPLETNEIIEEFNRRETTLEGTDEDSQSRARGAPTLSDAKCNSKPLRDLIRDSIVRNDAMASKRAIHEASITRFPDSSIDIICSGTGFTYLVSTTEHCEAQKGNVICFVYKRPLPR